MSRHRLDSRLSVLEARGISSRSYVVRIPDGADPAEIEAAIALHRTRTGYRGPVILAPLEAESVDAWAARYAPAGEAA